jgi:hypothetical protein
VSHPGLRYSWPRFLGDAGGSGIGFWNRLKRNILEDLKGEAVLESRANRLDLYPPRLLTFIPRKFRLARNPIVEDSETMKRHLSFLYDSENGRMLPELKLLGVKEMTDSDFLREFRTIINRGGADFLRAKSNEWHSKVAELLVSIARPWDISTLPLVPLRDGRWVCSSENHLFLSTGSSNLAIPNGIDICLVDTEACRDENRKTFCKWLGIGRCSRVKVCEMIIERHRLQARTLTLNDSVSDVNYLFDTPISVFSGPFNLLRLVDENMAWQRGKHLYAKNTAMSSAISNHAGNHNSGIKMLHPSSLLG